MGSKEGWVVLGCKGAAQLGSPEKSSPRDGWVVLQPAWRLTGAGAGAAPSPPAPTTQASVARGLGRLGSGDPGHLMAPAADAPAGQNSAAPGMRGNTHERGISLQPSWRLTAGASRLDAAADRSRRSGQSSGAPSKLQLPQWAQQALQAASQQSPHAGARTGSPPGRHESGSQGGGAQAAQLEWRAQQSPGKRRAGEQERWRSQGVRSSSSGGGQDGAEPQLAWRAQGLAGERTGAPRWDSGLTWAQARQGSSPGSSSRSGGDSGGSHAAHDGRGPAAGGQWQWQQHLHWQQQQHPHMQQQQQQPQQQDRPQQLGGRANGRLPFVPIKNWRSCWEVAEGMAALPQQRLDQKLLSAALQHMATLHSASPDPREDTEAFAQLLQLCTPRLHQFDAHGLAIIVRTAAKLDVRLPQEVLDGWAAAAAARLPEFNTQDLANSIFSLGKLGQALPAPTLRQFTAAAARACHAMPPLELSPTLLGLAHMGCTPGEAAAVAEAILEEAVPRLTNFSAQELANLVWAFSKVTDMDSWVRCGRLLWRALDEVAARAAGGEFLPQEVNALLMAQANMSFYHPRCLAALVRAVASDTAQLEGQHLGNTLLALGMLPHPGCSPATGPPQPRVGAGEGEGPGGQELGGKLGEAPIPGSCPEGLGEAPELGSFFASPQVCHVTQEQVAALREEVARRLQQRLPPSSPHAVGTWALCHAVWGLAALQCCTQVFWELAVARLEEWGWQERDEGHAQLRHAQLLLNAEEPALGWTAKLPPQLEERGRRAWVTTHDNRVSSWQRAVAELLWSEGLEAELEHATEDGLFAVDVALPKQRVAVEVDGPHHFSSNRALGHYWPLGRTTLRDRLLKARGWTVLSLPIHAWQERGGQGREVQRQWLLRAVEEACRASQQLGKEA